MRRFLPALRPTAPHLLAAVLLAGACVGDLLTITVEQSGKTTVEGAGVLGTALGALSIGGFDDLSVTVDQELANQGVSPGDVSSVYVTEIVLSTPDGEDLSFLESLSFSVSAPGLDTVVIAHGTDFPAGQKTVALTMDGVDLTDYVVAEEMTITTDAAGTLPADDTTITADMTLEITATPQGACNQAQKASEQ